MRFAGALSRKDRVWIDSFRRGYKERRRSGEEAVRRRGKERRGEERRRGGLFEKRKEARRGREGGGGEREREIGKGRGKRWRGIKVEKRVEVRGKMGRSGRGEGWKKVEESERSVVRGGIVGGGGTEGSAYAFHPPPACHQLTSSTYAPIHVPLHLSTVLHHLRPLVISFAFLLVVGLVY